MTHQVNVARVAHFKATREFYILPNGTLAATIAATATNLGMEEQGR
jgi:hypothetical protein